MVNPVAVTSVIVVVVLAFAGMLWSWRRRSARQARLVVPVESDPGAEAVAAGGTYLATTFADRPLDRVTAAGLGFRAAARVVRSERALRIERAGAAPIALPLDRVTGAGTGSWALDRGVEREGLLIIAWSLDGPAGPVAVESAFRLDPAGQAALLTALPPRPAPEVLDGRP